jgi:hypothetical protein
MTSSSMQTEIDFACIDKKSTAFAFGIEVETFLIVVKWKEYCTKERGLLITALSFSGRKGENNEEICKKKPWIVFCFTMVNRIYTF